MYSPDALVAGHYVLALGILRHLKVKIHVVKIVK